MREEIAFDNGRISYFEGLMTLTMYRLILHTVMHHSSTSTYIRNVIEIEKKIFCGRTDGGRTFEFHFIRYRLGGVDLKSANDNMMTRPHRLTSRNGAWPSACRKPRP